ncbi:transcription factor E2F8 [Sebastes umbrosus]|uniref:transcription factor E2F8 n=1 Tax=Sebastes umbrosus TaxID=72105 RepID=UPI00189F40E4|nr:transcription factor E2F8 [Sebastes umbrosus]XP_037614121.1 transcription factor E2F8 [Sebastes umbrosus]
MSSTALESQTLTQRSHSKDDGFVAPQVPGNTPKKLSGPCAVSVENQLTMGPLTTPKKGREVGSVDPWTPTSNLKMLISAASPDIRNREKELCMDGLDPSQDTENGEESEKMISRKEKSLGLLCHKFLARYPDHPDPALKNYICLDDVATELSVERRRIYDIMNVLESLHMVSRSAKNRYTWHGRTKLAQTLAILKQVGEEQRYGQQMLHIRQRILDREFDLDGEEKENEEVVELESGEQGLKELFFVELPGVEFKAASVNSRKDKSLRVMSQKFVMLFLVSNPRVVSLDVAAKILIGEDQGADQDKNKFKTKVRRLYDIANVLRSLKLIEKVHVTEMRGRKPAFEWVGPEEFPQVKDLENSTSECSTKKKSVLESRASVDNCAKKLFSSPGAKRSFTRHPSLIKLAKSIQDDRRKINSAPSSPVKSSLSDSWNTDFPNKMAQLAAICKIELDQKAPTGAEDPKPAAAVRLEPTSSVSMEPPQAPLLTPTQETRVNTTVHLTPNTPLAALPAGSVAYIPAQCSPLIPVLLHQPRGSGPYAVYMHTSSPRPNPLARPQPTSLAVRSMTFEDKTGQSPTGQCAAKSWPAVRASDVSPLALKRLRSDSALESSPSKAKRTDPNFKDASPKLCEILQARLKTRRGTQQSSRSSPRALHLDPEFVNTPGGAAASQTLEQSLETFLDREDKTANSDSEARLTPVRIVPFTPGQLHAETLVPAGYLIPISQQSLIGYRESQDSGRESSRASTPTYNIYQTPTAGSRAALAQEITPTSLRLHRSAAASPHAIQQAHRLHSPSPAILNFTLQNLGLISGSSPGNTFAAPQTPECANTLSSPLPGPLALQQRGMVFIKPVSPVPLQQAVSGQPMALFSVQQPLMTTPKGTALPQQSFFHTPVPVSPLAAMVTTSGHLATKTVYIPQRKLDVATEDS